MKIDYRYMGIDALQKTYILCRAKENNEEADKIKKVLEDRGAEVPNYKDKQITFTSIDD